MGIEMHAFEEMLNEVKGISLISLEEMGQGGASEAHVPLLDGLMTHHDQDPLELLHLADLKKTLVRAIEQLPEKEQLVISLYYFDELTMKEVGKVLTLTESRVSQLHTQAVLRLRGKLTAFLPG